MTSQDEGQEELQRTANSKYKEGVNRNARLVVRNVSFKATEEALREYFSPYGNVEEVKLLKKPDGKLVGCGFIHYTHVPMATEAITATNKKPFLGRTMHVSWAVPKHKYGEGTNENFKNNKTKSSTDDGDDPDQKPEIEDQDGKKKPEKAKERVNRNARLIIRNVSFKTTEESLREHFEPYGNILEVKLLKKPDGKLVGCAFVHFKNVPMAKKALLNTNMKPFLGRPISVDWAVAKNKYMQFLDKQNLQLQEDIKKEDSDSDAENGPSFNVSQNDLKEEVKRESNDESDSDKSEGDSEEGESDDESIDGGGDDVSQISTQDESKRVKLNDAEDGCTVFMTNIPFGIDSDQLRQFIEKTSPVKYALVCIDKLTEHSRGTGFAKFLNKEDTDKFLSLPAEELKIDGQVMQVKPALKRESLQGGNKKQPKDNRNLYLVKEGVIVAGTKAAVGVSSLDMTKRLALERSKTQMLKNLNRFVSRYRLVVSNLPHHFDDSKLRAICVRAAGPRAVITEARVMRQLRESVLPNGKHPSKGYGFVMFMRHEDALSCLRKLNNNPDIFDKINRPIISFSIEDRTALNARKKRLEKSIANNPLAQKDNGSNNSKFNNKRKFNGPDESFNRKRNSNNRPDESFNRNRNYNNRPDESFNKNRNHNNRPDGSFNKNRNHNNRPDESQFKNGKKFNNKKKFEKDQPEIGKFVRVPRDDVTEYSGLTAKEGTQHAMRSNHKLRMQADVHRQNVKHEKKQNKHSLKLKRVARERIKQPKQKINKNKKGNKINITEKTVKTAMNDKKNFSDLVTKYKSKLVGNSLDRVKVKWYET